jgi:DNA-binding Lrp family transcriptional regulator
MTSAYILINAETGSDIDVLKSLRKVKGVSEACLIYGVYDLILKVTAESMDKLKEILKFRVRRIDNVRSTLTLIVIEEANT